MRCYFGIFHPLVSHTGFGMKRKIVICERGSFSVSGLQLSSLRSKTRLTVPRDYLERPEGLATEVASAIAPYLCGLAII